MSSPDAITQAKEARDDAAAAWVHAKIHDDPSIGHKVSAYLEWGGHERAMSTALIQAQERLKELEGSE